MHQDELFIGGAWARPSSDRHIDVISPHSEQLVARVAAAGPADVDAAVAAARAAFDTGAWPHLPPEERIAIVRRLAGLYGQRGAEMAEVITSEIGAPIAFSRRAQVGLPAMMMTAFCDLAENYPFSEARRGMYGLDIQIRREPVGVVAAIVPWNMPQFLTVTKLIPALLAGCTVIVKPAEESPLDALLLAEMIADAGVPDGVVSVLPGGPETGGHLVAHPGVDKVSFTGSTATGTAVATACAARLRRVSLELGGKSAAIVLDDADPGAVAAGVRSASLSNSGQICNALTRVLVPEGRADNTMRVAREEIFGPVLTVIEYGDEADAVRIANDSDCGLAGSVWTADSDRGLAIAGAIRTGTFGVNQGYTMDPFAPFGGVKCSGYGRELGREGLDGYTDTKSIAVAAG